MLLVVSRAIWTVLCAFGRALLTLFTLLFECGDALHWMTSQIFVLSSFYPIAQDNDLNG